MTQNENNKNPSASYEPLDIRKWEFTFSEILANEQLFRAFTNKQEFKEKLSNDHSLIETLSTREDFRTIVASLKSTQDLVAKNTDVQSKIERTASQDEQYLKGILNSSKIKRLISERTNYLESLVTQAPERFSGLSAIKHSLLAQLGDDERLRQDVYHSLLSNSGLISELLAKQDFKALVESDESTQHALLKNEALLNVISQSHTAVSYLAKVDAVKQKVRRSLLSSDSLDKAFVDELLSASHIKDIIAKQADYLESMVTQAPERFSGLSAIKHSLLAQLGDDERLRQDVYHSLLSNSGLISELLAKQDFKALVESDESTQHALLKNEALLNVISQSHTAVSYLAKVDAVKQKVRRSLLSSDSLDKAFVDELLSASHIKDIIAKQADYLESIISKIPKRFIELPVLKKELFSSIQNDQKAHRVVEFLNLIERTSKFLEFATKDYRKEIDQAIGKILAGSKDFHNLAASLFSKANKVRLFGKVVYFMDWRGFWVPFQEIFLNLDYHFDTNCSDTLFIDGGANIGLATIYLKNLYPEMEVICFEPSSAHRDLLAKNIKSLGLKNVTVLPYALAGEKCEMILRIPEDDSLAGSIIRYNGVSKEIKSLSEQKIQCVTLNEFINKKCDLLKLDIEGAEVEVLEASSNSLRFIDRLFIEFHGFGDEPYQKLERMLALLRQNDFQYRVDKALGTRNSNAQNQFNNLHSDFSLIVHATKRNIQ